MKPSRSLRTLPELCRCMGLWVSKLYTMKAMRGERHCLGNGLPGALPVHPLAGTSRHTQRQQIDGRLCAR